MPQSVTRDDTVTRTATLPFSRVHDAVLAVDKSTGYCYALNATGGRIWDLLVTPQKVLSLRDRLCAEYSIDPETCMGDVVEILSEMNRAGLISKV